MSNKNSPVIIFLCAFACIFLAMIFNIISDYAATAELGRLFRHLSTIAIVFGAGLLIVNYAKQ